MVYVCRKACVTLPHQCAWIFDSIFITQLTERHKEIIRFTCSDERNGKQKKKRESYQNDEEEKNQRKKKLHSLWLLFHSHFGIWGLCLMPINYNFYNIFGIMTHHKSVNCLLNGIENNSIKRTEKNHKEFKLETSPQKKRHG